MYIKTYSVNAFRLHIGSKSFLCLFPLNRACNEQSQTRQNTTPVHHNGRLLLIRFQYLPPDQPLIEELSQKSDLRLFKSVISNPSQILNKFLPPNKTTNYSMRSRPHNRQLPMDDSFERRGFINRLLFVV